MLYFRFGAVAAAIGATSLFPVNVLSTPAPDTRDSLPTVDLGYSVYRATAINVSIAIENSVWIEF